MPVGTLSYCPKIVWNGNTLQLRLPCLPWAPVSNGIGGRDVSASGVPVAYQVRRDQMCQITLRFFEAEWANVGAWLEWAQSTAGSFTFRLDGNDPTSQHTCYLETPAMGAEILPARDGSNIGAYTLDVRIRDTTGTRFDYGIVNF